jgi:hypothetical protein
VAQYGYLHFFGPRIPKKMACAEHERLRSAYDVALLRWNEMLWSSSDQNLIGLRKLRAEQGRQRVTTLRDDAWVALHDHCQACHVCTDSNTERLQNME